jgi:gliding motility-associated-like protein
MKTTCTLKITFLVLLGIVFSFRLSAQSCAITTSPDPNICMGSTATLSVSGAHTYVWSPGLTTNDSLVVAPAVTTTYAVIGTDTLLACSDTAYITVTVNDLPFVNFNFTPSTSVCQGTAVTLFGNGANTYTWTGGIADGASFVPMVSTTYTVTGTDVNGCSNTAQVTVTVKPLPPVNSSADTTICAGASVNLTASGAGFYLWSPGPMSGASVMVTPFTSTTYTVTGTNFVTGCSNTSTTSITVNPIPVVSYLVSPNDTVCLGTSVTLSGTGANSYSWTGGITDGFSFIPPSSGLYTVTGTTAAGCSNTATALIVVNSNPAVGYTLSPNDTICSGSSIVLTGTGANTYTWTGGVINGVPYFPAIGTGSYTVTGTDVIGCTNTATVNIMVNPQPLVSYTLLPTDTVCAGTSVTLTGSGATTYAWSGGVTNGVAFIPATSGTYTVMGTDVNGCTNTATASVVVISLPVVGILASPGASICTGSPLTLSGTGATAYTWDNGVTDGVTFIPLSNTTYTVIGSNGMGCVDTASISITINPIPSVSFTISPNDTVCSGVPVVLAGVGPHSFLWSGGVTDGVSFNPTITNAYTVTVTDINGCTNTASTTITVNPLPVTTLISNSPVCFGSTILLNASGGTTYSWSGPASFNSSMQNPTIPFSSLLNGGDYMATISNAWGCQVIDTVNVAVIVPPSGLISPSPSASLCLGDSVTLSSSVGSMGYLWDTGDTTSSIVVYPAVNTTYALTMSNPPFCNGTVMDFINISVFANPLGSIVSAMGDTVCASTPVSLTASGGVNYLWNTGASTDNINVVPVVDTTYAVLVTSANGCMDTAFISLTALSNPLPPVLTASAPVICNYGSIQLYSNISTNISWAPVISSSDTLTVSTPDDYQLTVTDSNGCSNSTTLTVVRDVVVAGIGGDTILCSGSPNLLTASGGVTYIWNTTDTISSITVQPSVPTLYAVQVTDALGCHATNSLMVYPFAFLNISPQANMDTLTLFENTQGYVNLILNDTNYTSVSIITPPAKGTYTLNLNTIEYIPGAGFTGNDSLQYITCSSVCTNSCDTAWLKIKVLPGVTVSIPQVVTPNGDNFNDTWKIANLNLFPDNEVILMNRWGDVVYQAKPYNNDWCGQANTGIQLFGNNLSTGTFYYIVKLGATQEPMKGFIELIK